MTESKYELLGTTILSFITAVAIVTTGDILLSSLLSTAVFYMLVNYRKSIGLFNPVFVTINYLRKEHDFIKYIYILTHQMFGVIIGLFSAKIALLNVYDFNDFINLGSPSLEIVGNIMGSIILVIIFFFLTISYIKTTQIKNDSERAKKQTVVYGSYFLVIFVMMGNAINPFINFVSIVLNNGTLLSMIIFTIPLFLGIILASLYINRQNKKVIQEVIVEEGSLEKEIDYTEPIEIKEVPSEKVE